MLSSMAFGMPQRPCGGGSIVAPISACPSNKMETKALRSSAIAMARRMSMLSKGDDDELTMMLVETLVGSTAQTAFGDCDFRSFSSGIVMCVGNVMSNLPATKARMAVERFGMMVNSMPSR